MALSSKQRKNLPDSAFAYPKERKYPVPTKAQAKKAGISEKKRLRLHRDALAKAAQTGTSGTYSTVQRKVEARSGGKVKTKGGKSGG